MQVIVNSDHNITLTEESIDAITSTVESKLGHVMARLTRVEVALSDGSAGRSTGDDIRCQLEARPEGMGPLFATENAATVDAALTGALRRMHQVLESDLGRLDQHKGAGSMGGVEPR